jgi:mannose/fructose/N-acetylgalactosamine-specific phosphotransferase system component IIC
VGPAALGLLVLNLVQGLEMRLYALGLDAITFVRLFFVAVALLGLLMGLVHMSWRTKQDRREQEREDRVSVRR